MAKSNWRQKRSEKQILKQNEAFTKALVKVHERLTIMFDHNLRNKVDPCESDVMLLEDLYRWYDTSSLDFTELYDDEAEDGPQLSIDSDKKSEKK